MARRSRAPSRRSPEQRDDLRVAPGDYADLFETAIADRDLPPRRDGRARACAFSAPLEARLVSVDRVVLGALVEGVWPPETRSDPWLSRPMRLELGLDLPERRIGLSAHDFAQLLGMPEVILTRAAKLGGAPTVASRFTQRLAAVAGEAHWNAALARGEKYLAWARDLDRADSDHAGETSAPDGRRSTRARTRLSVTEIEHWLRDPYTIYAKHILKLAPLDAVDTPPGARDRGTVIHGAIGEFTENYAKALPADPLAALLALGEKHFARAAGFSRSARVLVAALPAHRALVRRLGGAAAREGAARCMPKSARASTIRDRHAQFHADHARRPHRAAAPTARYAILDYKTGSTPTEKQVRTGLSPQLTLEGAILRAGRVQGRAGGLDRRVRLCGAARRRAGGRGQSRSNSRTARRTATPTRRWRGSKASSRASPTRRRPIARWSARCGRRAMATTTIWRA